MNRLTGLFLGAGASYEAGMPLVWELTAKIKSGLNAEKIQELNAYWRMQGSGYPDSVVEDLISILERPTVHYEGVLGYMEVQRRRQLALQQEYHALYSWLVEQVYRLLYYRQVNNAFLNQHLPLYDGIRALAEANAPLWVFSLNHDVIVEAIAARLLIPVHSGFSASLLTLPRRDASGRKKGEIRAEVLTKQDLDHRGMYFPNPRQAGIYLLKIHGALDLFTFNDGQDLLKILPSAPGQDGVIDVLRAANEDLFYPLPGAPGRRAKHTINEICYADDHGVMQFLRRTLLAGAFKFDARTSQALPKIILKHFRQNLNFVSTVICIGYSFGDVHINLVLREWLEFSSDRQLEIVSPNAQEVPPFLLHLSPQVVVTKSRATDYLNTPSPPRA
jgi:hypothetical protein